MKYRITFLNLKESSEGIILTADEVNYVKFDYSQGDKESFANKNSRVSLKISGKLISNLEEENNLNDNMGFNNLYNASKNDELNGGIEKLSQEYQTKFKKLNLKIFNKSGEPDKNKFYSQNRENIKKLSEFAFEYKKENDYRDIIVEADLGSGEMYTLLFKEMYAEKFKQIFSIDTGVSTFIIDLKQRYYEDAKVEVYY
ncbi:MAG: hypothetical protein HXM47_09505 [Pseudoleptotrichia goodfellowii]|nr:hypothetical protein [Pseudoleptotrichia goodfellowii]